MKTIIALATALLLFAGNPALARGASSGGHAAHGTTATGPVNPSSHLVTGYTTKNGTYVAPHRATNPNGTKNDNFSTQGNVNPYTGKSGTKKPDSK
jgi:hypothetical protein